MASGDGLDLVAADRQVQQRGQAFAAHLCGGARRHRLVLARPVQLLVQSVGSLARVCIHQQADTHLDVVSQLLDQFLVGMAGLAGLVGLVGLHQLGSAQLLGFF